MSNDRDDDEILLDQQETPRLSSKLWCCRCWGCFSDMLSMFLGSLKIIFLENPKLFLSIYVFTCLPISLLLTSQSLSSRRLKAHIARLEWLSRAAEIWIEADNVRDESQADLRLLFLFKALYGIPIFLFSLLSVTATVSAAKKRPQTVLATVRTVRATWTRPAITCVVNSLALIAWAGFAHVVADVASTAAGIRAAVAATVIVAAAEAYLMAVLSLALVVSVAEDKKGVEAVRAGSGLMRGRRRVVGWALSGLVVVGSGCIAREMAGLMDGGDWGMSGLYGSEWTVRIRYGYMSGLVMMLGWMVLWSYVVFTVFYCDCKKKRRQHFVNRNGASTSKELEEY